MDNYENSYRDTMSVYTTTYWITVITMLCLFAVSGIVGLIIICVCGRRKVIPGRILLFPAESQGVTAFTNPIANLPPPQGTMPPPYNQPTTKRDPEIGQ